MQWEEVMRYGKIRIDDGNLIFTKRMMTNSLPCEDILWAYRRKEDTGGKEGGATSGTDGNSIMIRTRKGKRYKFDMAEDETKACLNHLKELNPWISLGFPKGARIPLQNLPNTRDLGALKTVDGRFILPHKLIRSGELYHMSKTDVRTLREEYHVTTVIDFRTDAERTHKPDTEMGGVCYIDNPILEEATVGITREKGMMELLMGFDGDAGAYMEQLYNSLVLDSFSMNQYAKFFQYLLDQENGAVLWHCTAGKDRVGIGTALLLSALGVPKDTIYEDYLRTNQYLQQETEYLIQLLGERLNGHPHAVENIRVMMGVDHRYLEGALRAIDAEYGSMDRYLKRKMCLTPKALERLQNKYLV